MKLYKKQLRGLKKLCIFCGIILLTSILFTIDYTLIKSIISNDMSERTDLILRIESILLNLAFLIFCTLKIRNRILKTQ